MVQLQERRYKANGKLMLTGEYMVLSGADAVALPLSMGQQLAVKRAIKRPSISWKTFVEGIQWFDAYYSLPELAIANTSDFPTAQNLRDLLIAARELNPGFPENNYQYEVKSNIDFNINWGFGSSSSLIVLVAKWAKIDPFALHFKVSNGSGYDIAAALSDSPVLYRLEGNKPVYETVNFYPEFRNKLYFAYLGKKRSSSLAIESFKMKPAKYKDDLEKISSISRRIIHADTIFNFNKLLKEHDRVISNILGEKTLMERKFSDFMGYIKPLGAWGGDFALFVTDLPKEYLLSYFRKKEIKAWFNFMDIMKFSKTGVNVQD